VLGALFLLLGATLALATVIGTWVAFVMVGGTAIVLAVVLGLMGCSHIGPSSVIPRRALEALQQSAKSMDDILR